MTARRLKILILGGYGTFGGRLAQLLADEDRLTLVIGGRSFAKAAAFCSRLQAQATAVPLAFDRDREIEPQLRKLAPDMVVDASGPFQSYGADPYRVVKAAIALRIDYLDLADASAFVEGITQFDADARGRGLFVLAGVSSFPVLTAAVIRRLAQGMVRIEAVTGGIAPSPHANVGLNVVRAIASYAGRPVALVRGGQKTVGYALIETARFTIAPPGCLPLHPIRFSLVDVPDLLVLPALWPSLRSVWLGAGPVPEIWHRVLNALAWAVRLRLLPSLLPLAGLMHATMNRLSFGEHRGGMFVALEGVGDDGQRMRAVLAPPGRRRRRTAHSLDGGCGDRSPLLGGQDAATRRTRGSNGAGTGRLRGVVRTLRHQHRALADRLGIGASSALSAHAGGGVGPFAAAPPGDARGERAS